MRVSAWRDMDSNRPYLGLILSAHSLTAYVGRRLYRVQWHRATS